MKWVLLYALIHSLSISYSQDCACNLLRIPLNGDGERIITPAMVIANESECDPSLFSVELMDSDNQPLVDDNGVALPPNQVTCNYIGQDIMAAIIDASGRAICMGDVIVEDKQEPECLELPDITLNCDENQSPTELRSDTLYFPAGGIGQGVTGANPRYREQLNSIGYGRIRDVSLFIDATFENVSSLAISLFIPDGSFRRVINQPSSCSAIDDLQSTFNETGAVFDCSVINPISQTETQSFIDIIGTNKEGVWELAATDYNGAPFGNMNEAYLVITYDLMPRGADNCSYTVNYRDNEFNMNDCNIGTYQRTFTLTDDFGMSSECSQVVHSVDTSSMPFTVEWPEDISFSCDAEYDLSPTIEGAGRPIISINGCTSPAPSLINEEIYNDNSPGCITLLRYWRVRDWCSGMVMDIPRPQEVKVMDSQAPVISCPEDLTLAVDGNCQINFTENVPSPSVTDNCDNNPTWTYLVLDSSNTPVSDSMSLDRGLYTVRYYARDRCGNRSACDMALSVEDQTPPEPQCDQNTVASLGSSGLASICFDEINDGSSDNCGIDSIRLSNDGITFSECLNFSCNDLGNNTGLRMYVWDSSGLNNFCTFNVEIVDPIDPSITCPPNTSIICGDDIDNLDITGRPSSSDNCAQVDISYSDDRTALNACGLGNLIRTFTATDPSGNGVSCTQEIEIMPNTAPSIVFPQDTTVECPFRAEPISAGEPIITDDPCGNYQVLIPTQIETGSCATRDWEITRTWTVAHRCDRSLTFSMDQRIQIIDTTPPAILDCPLDFTVSEGSDNVDLVVSATDECGTVSIRNNALADYGQGNGQNDASGTYVEGNYQVQFVATDECGLEDTCTVNFIVENNFDLAISSNLNAGPEFAVGDIIELEVILTNDGDDAAYDVRIFDSIPEGLIFSTSNTEWIIDGDHAEWNISGPINPGDNAMSTLFLEVINGYSGLCLENQTEILFASESTGGSLAMDRDSEPGNFEPSEDDYSREILIYGDNAVDHDARHCADANGVATFVLTDYDNDIFIGSESVVITYHESESDAENGMDPVSNNFTTAEDTIFARVEGVNNLCLTVRELRLQAFCSQPVFSNVPTDITFSCDQTFSFEMDLVLMDTCNATVSIMNDSVAGDCRQEYLLTRTWTAANACGNTAEVSQSINVVDNTAPVISNVFDVTVDEGEFVTLVAQVTDNCAPSDSIIVTNNSPVGDGMRDASGVYDVGVTVVTFTAEDPCGNSTTVLIEVTVLETMMAMGRSRTVYLNHEPLVLDASDFDAGSIGSGLQFYLTDTVFDCSDLGAHEIGFVAKDRYGRSDTDWVQLDILALPLNEGEQKDTIVLTEELMSSLEIGDLLHSDVPLLCSDDVEWFISLNKLDCSFVNQSKTIRISGVHRSSTIYRDTIEVYVIDNSGLCRNSSSEFAIAGLVSSPLGQTISKVDIEFPELRISSSTDEQGVYSIINSGSIEYLTIRPSFSNGNVYDGLNTMDLIQIKQHILGLRSFTDLSEYVASDVNNSGTITTLDMIEIRRMILRQTTSFANSESYAFYPSRYSVDMNNPFQCQIPSEIFLENVDNKTVDNNFTMVKKGDVNHDMFIESRSEIEGTLILRYEKWRPEMYRNQYAIVIEPTKEIVSGLQFAIDLSGWDGIENIWAGTLDNFTSENYHFDRNTKVLYVSWDNANGKDIIEKKSIVRIELNNTLSDFTLMISDVYMIAEAYGTNMTTRSIKLLPSEHGENNEKALILYQNHPNPANGTTFISFETAMTNEVQLEIFTMEGRKVYSDRAIFSKGRHSFQVRVKALGEAGAYYYKLSSGDIELVKKMITI